MLKKFFELVGMATCGYIGYCTYKEYKKRTKVDEVTKEAEEEAEDFTVEVEDFFDETVAE